MCVCVWVWDYASKSQSVNYYVNVIDFSINNNIFIWRIELVEQKTLLIVI